MVCLNFRHWRKPEFFRKGVEAELMAERTPQGVEAVAARNKQT